MSIRIKLILGYVILSLLVAISSYFGIRGIQVAEDGSRYITEQTIPVIETLEDLRFAGLRIVSSTSEFLLILSEKAAVNEEEGEEEERNEIQLASQLYQESFGEYALLVEAFFHDERAFAEAISLSGKKLQQTSLELIALKEKGGAGKGILELKEMFEKQEKQYLKDVHDALAHEEEELMNGQEHVEAIVQRAINTMILVGISSFIIAVLLGILIARSLSEPMHKLSQAAKIIGSGNFDIQIDYQSSDEMGVLAAAFNTMADNLAKILVNKDQLETLVVKRTDELRKARAELESLVEEWTSELQDAPSTGKCRILYIEDDPGSASLVLSALHHEQGWEVMTSPTAEQGILLAEVKIPDIILMDISLPGIDGIAALGVLRRLDSTHRITVIALTAKAMDGDIKAGEEAGFDDYLTKPIDIQHLRSVIVRHISASNLKI